ncbi:MAG: AsmA family protein [Acidobacteriota bacterium]|nr:AsmA family protein [Acidobacteriota bacterium]
MKRTARIVGIALLLLVAVLFSLPFLINANEFRPMLEARLSQGLAREVKLGDLKFSLWSGGVTASDLAIADHPAFSKAPFLRAKSLTVSAALLPFIFSRKLQVTGLIIDQPEIALLRSAPGQWNFSNIGVKSPTGQVESAAPSGSSLDISVKVIKITGGRLSVGRIDSRVKPLVLDNVNFELRDFAPASVMPFDLTAKVAGGGDIALSGKAGPIHTEDVVMTPANATLKVTHLDVNASGLMEASTGIGGLISVDGAGSSDGHNLELKGRVKADQLRLVRGGSPSRRPVELDFTINHNLQRGTGSLPRGEIHVGSAVAVLTGTYVTHGESAVLNANLSGSGMPVPELEALLPALNIVLPQGSSLQGGTMTVKTAIDGPLSRLSARGFVSLDHTRLAGFDLGGKMAVIEMLAGIRRSPDTEIETLRANFASSPESTNIADLKLVAPAIGEVTGAGVVSASHALDFKMRVTLHTGGVVMTALGQRGDTTVPFMIQGTASNPVFKADVAGTMKSLAGEELKKLGGNNAEKAVGILEGFLKGKKK